MPSFQNLWTRRSWGPRGFVSCHSCRTVSDVSWGANADYYEEDWYQGVTSLIIFPFLFLFFSFLLYFVIPSHESHYDSSFTFSHKSLWLITMSHYDSHLWLPLTHHDSLWVVYYIYLCWFIDCPRVHWSTNLILQYYKYGQSRALQPQTWLLVSYGTESQ